MKSRRSPSRARCAGLLLVLAGGLALQARLGGQTASVTGKGGAASTQISGAEIPAELQAQLHMLEDALKAAQSASDAKAAAIALNEIGNLYFRAGSYLTMRPAAAGTGATGSRSSPHTKGRQRCAEVDARVADLQRDGRPEALAATVPV